MHFSYFWNEGQSWTKLATLNKPGEVGLKNLMVGIL